MEYTEAAKIAESLISAAGFSPEPGSLIFRGPRRSRGTFEWVSSGIPDEVLFYLVQYEYETLTDADGEPFTREHALSEIAVSRTLSEAALKAAVEVFLAKLLPLPLEEERWEASDPLASELAYDLELGWKRDEGTVVTTVDNDGISQLCLTWAGLHWYMDLEKEADGLYFFGVHNRDSSAYLAEVKQKEGEEQEAFLSRCERAVTNAPMRHP